MKKLSLLILTMLLLASCAAKTEEKTLDSSTWGSSTWVSVDQPAVLDNSWTDISVTPDDDRNTPAGADFPVSWSTKFSDLPKLEVGKEIPITISIWSTLFDMEWVELVPKTGNALVLVSWEKWVGDIKKGQFHDVNMVVKPTKKWFNGIYWVKVIYPDFYKDLRNYIKSQKQWPYEDETVKESIIEQIDWMENVLTNYEEWFWSSIEIKADN